jgi:hypothetical protein
MLPVVVRQGSHTGQAKRAATTLETSRRHVPTNLPLDAVRFI